MQTSQRGIDLIKEFEGLRLEAYKCSAGKWTIGYGSTRGVKPADVITADQAEERLRFDLRHAEAAVKRWAPSNIRQHQFDALVAFTFNVGAEALKHSTLLAKLTRGDARGAAEEFERWVYAGGQVLPGLVRRRKAERALFENVLTSSVPRDPA
jgi:lysozyme